MEPHKNLLVRRLSRRVLELEDKLYGRPFPKLKRVKQITVSHCGPAVLEALFSFFGIKVFQKAVVKSLRAGKKIKRAGISIKDLGRAVKIIGKKKYVFWKKANATINDLWLVVNKYKYPVGVEWQGIFYEDEDEDNGHYSVVTVVNKKAGFLRLADPYVKFAGLDRKFSFKNFEKRWWDENEIIISGTKKKKVILDKEMMFLITPKGVTFPKKLRMVKGS